jgi:hypothetical protein
MTLMNRVEIAELISKTIVASLGGGERQGISLSDGTLLGTFTLTTTIATALQGVELQETARAEQLSVNCDWFTKMFERAHAALKLPIKGGYQRMVTSVVEHLEAGMHEEGSAEVVALRKRIEGLSEALRANAVFHTPVAKAKLTSFGEWDEYQRDAIDRTKEALGNV